MASSTKKKYPAIKLTPIEFVLANRGEEFDYVRQIEPGRGQKRWLSVDLINSSPRAKMVHIDTEDIGSWVQLAHPKATDDNPWSPSGCVKSPLGNIGDLVLIGENKYAEVLEIGVEKSGGNWVWNYRLQQADVPVRYPWLVQARGLVDMVGDKGSVNGLDFRIAVETIEAMVNFAKGERDGTGDDVIERMEAILAFPEAMAKKNGR